MRRLFLIISVLVIPLSGICQRHTDLSGLDLSGIDSIRNTYWCGGEIAVITTESAHERSDVRFSGPEVFNTGMADSVRRVFYGAGTELAVITIPAKYLHSGMIIYRGKMHRLATDTLENKLKPFRSTVTGSNMEKLTAKEARDLAQTRAETLESVLDNVKAEAGFGRNQLFREQLSDEVVLQLIRLGYAVSHFSGYDGIQRILIRW